MANRSRIKLLKRSVKKWNRWRNENRRTEVNLRGIYLRNANLRSANLIDVDLRNADLSNANLRDANLGNANLSDANLRDANLSNADLSDAKLIFTKLISADLSNVDLRDADLKNSNLRSANLSNAKLSSANLIRANLVRVNLSKADLNDTDFKDADLSNADFRDADLRNTNFSGIKALCTNFSNANLTGACIGDWNINSETQFSGVICEYIYLKEKYQDNELVFSERRPHNPNKNFAPGDFARLVQQANETLDLIFSEGIDWTAFAQTFQGIQIQTQSDELSIQAIEKKRDGSFVVKVDTPSTADKAALEKEFWAKYQPLLEAKEAEYRALLQEQEIKHQQQRIQDFQQHNTNLTEMVKILGSRPINIENNFMAENNTKSTEVEMNVSGGQVTGMAGKVAGDQVVNQKPSLAESAIEIQLLLQILDKSYPSDIPEDTQAEIDVAVKNINKNPALKERVVGALKAGGLEAVKEITDNPYVNILVATYEGWQEPN